MSMMYSLTAMTGKEASATRTVVIGTVEFNWRVWMILLWSSPIGVLAAAMAWPLIGELAVFMLPIVWGAALLLIQRRTRDGLQLRTYQAMWDKKKANTGQFFLCGVPIDINTSDYRTVTPNSVAYVPPEKASSETLVDVLSRVPLAPGVVSAAERDAAAPVALPFADTEDPAEAARARRAAEAASRPQPVETIAEPVRVAAPAPEPFAAAPESAAAHIEQPAPQPVHVPAPAPRPVPVSPVPVPAPGVPVVPVNQPFPEPAPYVPDPLFDTDFDPFASMAAPAPVPDHVPGPALPGLDESTIGLEAPDDLPDVASFFETTDPAHRSRFGRKKDDQ